jgi:hypothetical protein
VTPEPRPAGGTSLVAYEVYGAGVSIGVPHTDLVPRVVAQFPADAIHREPGPDDWRYELTIDTDGRYAIVQHGKELAPPGPLERVLAALRRELFFHSVGHARDRLVVSAGVVAHAGRAILLPGRPMVGKTMLVAALVRAGAEYYYADDWALLDRDGLVHPFPTLLYIKNQEKLSVESLGGVRGDRPIPVGLIAILRYRPGSRWDPRPRTTADGMLALMRNAYGMDVPAFAMEAARNAASRALVIEGERDEASEAASALLELVSKAPAQTHQPDRRA